MRGIVGLLHDSVSLDIAAPPEVVWSLVTDVPRIGEWSPICRHVEWVGGATAAEVGARFVGTSHLGGARWKRECVITALDALKVFAFSTEVKGREHTRWRYELEPLGGGTRVTESYEATDLPRTLRLVFRGPHLRRWALGKNRRGMEATLAGLKAAAEPRGQD